MILNKKLHKQDLEKAALQADCTPLQSEEIWRVLQADASVLRRHKLSSTIYYFGGFLIFLALGQFLVSAYTNYEKNFLLLTVSIYALALYGFGLYFWKKKNQILGGMGVFLALSLIPVIVYTVLDILNVWPGGSPGKYMNFYQWISGGWFLMEIITITATYITLRFIRYPCLTAILYLTLWFASLDILPFFAYFISKNIPSYIFPKISIIYGASLTIFAFILDKKNREKFSLWAYVFGVSIFWIGLSVNTYKTEWGHAIYCLLNIGMIMLSALLSRRIFAVLGVFGVLFYLEELIGRHFSLSQAFPFLLSAVGIIVIVAGKYLFRSQNKQETL